MSAKACRSKKSQSKNRQYTTFFKRNHDFDYNITNSEQIGQLLFG